MAKNEPHEPRGETGDNGKPRKVEDRGAVENQSSVTPEDYPDSDGGRPDYGSPKRSDA